MLHITFFFIKRKSVYSIVCSRIGNSENNLHLHNIVHRFFEIAHMDTRQQPQDKAEQENLP